MRVSAVVVAQDPQVAALQERMKRIETMPKGDSRENEAEARRRSETRSCSNCGKDGHLARECSEEATRKCFHCDEAGRIHSPIKESCDNPVHGRDFVSSFASLGTSYRLRDALEQLPEKQYVYVI